MYNRTYWYDESVQYPYRYTETDNGDGTIEHVPSPGTVLQAGTPQNATNFNKIEDGICDARLAEDIFYQYQKNKEMTIDGRLDDHDAEFTAETGTVTLTNSNKVFFAFNDSGQTVALQTNRKTLNYDVEVAVTSSSGGQVGDVTVYDKQLNGFKLKFEGSAASVVVAYKVRGGMCA